MDLAFYFPLSSGFTRASDLLVTELHLLCTFSEANEVFTEYHKYFREHIEMGMKVEQRTLKLCVTS